MIEIIGKHQPAEGSGEKPNAARYYYHPLWLILSEGGRSLQDDLSDSRFFEAELNVFIVEGRGAIAMERL